MCLCACGLLLAHRTRNAIDRNAVNFSFFFCFINFIFNGGPYSIYSNSKIPSRTNAAVLWFYFCCCFNRAFYTNRWFMNKKETMWSVSYFMTLLSLSLSINKVCTSTFWISSNIKLGLENHTQNYIIPEKIRKNGSTCSIARAFLREHISACHFHEGQSSKSKNINLNWKKYWCRFLSGFCYMKQGAEEGLIPK